ncbi:MAG: hypothetical protein IJ412_05500 [Oscillospiraceae bacterium]|nr:hypothetical protein [Oscillospiraceae bacterium]
MQQPVLPAQTTVDTAPVSNRAALFGAEEGEPDLALLAKKLEQLADLYREFTPAQKADVERLYRNDPAGLAVIQGRTTGGDWLKEQRRTEAARAAAAAQRKEQAARTLAADPAVQADAIRGKELLHTPGAAKAVTENTQPAFPAEKLVMQKDGLNAKLRRILPDKIADELYKQYKNIDLNQYSDKIKEELDNFLPQDTVDKLMEDIRNFDLDNTDENIVLESNFFSAYKGVPVLRLANAKSSVSFGVIGLQKEKANKMLLNHEYGHTLQLDEKGALAYTLSVAIPSVVGFIFDESLFGDFSYYGAPWEAEADQLGGVTDRTIDKAPWPDAWYTGYEIYSDCVDAVSLLIQELLLVKCLN